MTFILKGSADAKMLLCLSTCRRNAASHKRGTSVKGKKKQQQKTKKRRESNLRLLRRACTHNLGQIMSGYSDFDKVSVSGE